MREAVGCSTNSKKNGEEVMRRISGSDHPAPTMRSAPENQRAQHGSRRVNREIRRVVRRAPRTCRPCWSRSSRVTREYAAEEILFLF